MIGVDTNVLVRYIVQDDPSQSKAAVKFIEKVCSKEFPGYINHIVLCELVWVLIRCYNVHKDKIIEILKKMMQTTQFQIHDTQTVWKALNQFQVSKADFPDCLLGQINAAYQCKTTVTFDKNASKLKEYKLIK
jgi:predicted nucleic-acid-binding protein